MAKLTLSSVHKSYNDVAILKDINLHINSGEFIVFVGPSGCGKSTLLRSIAGLEEIDVGEISIDDENILDKHPSQRGIAMVFQSYALYPHMSVFDNMAFNLKLSNFAKHDITKKVHEVAEILQLQELLNRLPKHLSGGQRQRVAIGRALVRNPKIFLFDEPLSNLDAALRNHMRIAIARLHKTLKSTMIYVTHDQTEAMTLSDRMVVLNKGEIEQVGKPTQLYHEPNSLFVATFIGNPKMNIIECQNISSSHPLHQSGASSIGIRPEHLQLTDKANALFSGSIDLIEEFGEYSLLYVECLTTKGCINLVAKAQQTDKLTMHSQVHLTSLVEHVHYFNHLGKRMNASN